MQKTTLLCTTREAKRLLGVTVQGPHRGGSIVFASREWNDLFDPSVPLHLGQSGDIRHIRSAREAAAILLDEWPEIAGPSYVKACRACLAAARGKINVSRARLALIEAARESGVLDESQLFPIIGGERNGADGATL